MKKSFFERTERHLVPCLIGCILCALFMNISIGAFLIGYPLSVVIATLLQPSFDKLIGIDSEDEDTESPQ